MTLGAQQRLFTHLIAQLITWAYDQGYELTLGEAYRTKAQQRAYVEQGKSSTMASRHLDRRAIDLNLFIDGVYQAKSEAYRPLGEHWKTLHPGCVWGGDWKKPVDGNHFELVVK
jgi:hypothetical protein